MRSSDEAFQPLASGYDRGAILSAFTLQNPLITGNFPSEVGLSKQFAFQGSL